MNKHLETPIKLLLQALLFGGHCTWHSILQNRQLLWLDSNFHPTEVNLVQMDKGLHPSTHLLPVQIRVMLGPAVVGQKAEYTQN